MIYKNLVILICSLLLVCNSFTESLGQVRLDTPNVESQLFLGDDENQPLLVGLGGSEGGNAWASDHWRETREGFIKQGYAFLAVGYFGAKNTPAQLDRIALDDVHLAIEKAAKNPKINRKKIAIIGGSRGGDLALLIASHFEDIKAVVAIVPSHVSFPGHTTEFTSSAWTFKGKQLPFVPVSEKSVPFLIKGDLRSTFETMLEDQRAVEKAVIKVEKIKGPILLISATRDEIAPTTPMCEKMVARLKAKRFKYHFEHLAIEGSHAQPLKHFDKIQKFLEVYF